VCGILNIKWHPLSQLVNSMQKDSHEGMRA
jgi:hypothetical protein